MLFYKERDSGRGIIFLIKQKQRQETEEQEAKKAMIHTLNNDTIAAVSTALTNSGIGIIRISGEGSRDGRQDFQKTKRQKAEG